MKKISFFALFLLLPNIALAYVPSDKNTHQYRWALAAAGDTIETYYNNYTIAQGETKLSLGMLVKMGDLIKKNQVRSPAELVNGCITEQVKIPQRGLSCIKSSGCKRQGKTYEKNALVVKAKEECTALVDDLIAANNTYAVNVRTATNPGTYVRKTDKCGGLAYKVVNVVPGKKTDNKIYLINANGSIGELKIDGVTQTTQTNETFINKTAQTKEVTANHTRGVYNGSYIFFMDVTDKFYELYNEDRGTQKYSVKKGLGLLPAMAQFSDEYSDVNVQIDRIIGQYDFKVSWTDVMCKPKEFGFRVPGQTRVQSHTNGVLFEGQVVTLEDLGHIFTGMVQADSTVPEKYREDVVEWLQGGKESSYANAIRTDAEEKTRAAKDDKTFAKTQTGKEQTAYNLARAHMAKTYNLQSSAISCSGKCNRLWDSFQIRAEPKNADSSIGVRTGQAGEFDANLKIEDTDDFVTCHYKVGGVVKKTVIYKFQDICNLTGDKDIPKI